MAESKPETEPKSPNLLDRAKEEIGAILHRDSSGNHNHHHHHHRETHGSRDDIDENTPISDVKAPNVIERAKEEIEALVQSIHQKKNHRGESGKEESKSEAPGSSTDDALKDLIERKKKELAAILRHDRSHRKETHGMRDDIDENTPMSDVKAPNMLERAKEEIEALVQTIHHPKKEQKVPVSSPKKSGGFMMHIGSLFEKICSPWSNKKD